MKSRTSLINKSVLASDIKRYGWVSIVYMMGLLILPLKIFFEFLSVQSLKESINGTRISDVLASSWNTEGLLILSVSILLGMLLFSYIQNKSACDSMHSLPLRKEILYTTHILSGLLMLIIPILFNTAVIIFLRATIDVPFSFGFKDIFIWAGLSILLSILFFSLSVFCGMLTATSILQGFVAIVLLLMPPFLYITVTYNFSYLIFGYVNYGMDAFVSRLSPIIRILNSDIDKITAAEIIIYIICCVVFLISSNFIYKARKPEVAGQSIAFSPLNYLFKYTAAFCGMLLFGSYFRGTTHITWAMYLGYLIGSFLCYLIAEMIINKSFWVFKKLKDYMYFCIALALIIGAIKLDIFGYERYIPRLEDIKKAYYSDYGFAYYSPDQKNSIFDDKELILSIRALHQAIVKNKKMVLSKNNYPPSETINASFVYYLSNNKKIMRGYSISRDDFKYYLKPIYENKIFKQKRNLIFKVASWNVKSIKVQKLGSEQTKEISQNQFKDIINIIKEEIYNSKYEEMFDNRPSWGTIDISLKSAIQNGYNYTGDVYISFEKSYSKLEKWLEQNGYLKYARVMPDDISYAAIGKINDFAKFQDKIYKGKYNQLIADSFKKVRDKKMIEKFLRKYKKSYIKLPESKYYVLFMGKNGEPIDVGVLASY